MEDIVKQRITTALKECGISIYAVSKITGYPQSNLNKQINGTTSMSLKTLLVLLDSIPSISTEWLFRGEGEMYKTASDNEGNNIDKSQYVSMEKYESIVNLFGQTAAELKERALECSTLYDEIKNLKKQLKLDKYA